MSEFRDELIKTTTFAPSLKDSVMSTFMIGDKNACDNAAIKTYELIKTIIRDKSKNAEYKIIDNKKTISGLVSVVAPDYSIKLSSDMQRFLLTTDGKRVVREFRERCPDADFYIKNDYCVFSCNLLRTVEHIPLFTKPYKTYYITDKARQVIESISKMAEKDDIVITYEYIELSGFYKYDGKKFIEKGNDRRLFSNYRYPTVEVILKYRITF